MIGDQYWSTGIVLRYRNGNKWSATAPFFDSGFLQDHSTEGELHTRYYVDLETAIRTVRADVEKLNIRFNTNQNGKSVLMIEGDGDDSDYPPPPNWKQVLHDAAVSIGWDSAYDSDEHES